MRKRFKLRLTVYSLLATSILGFSLATTFLARGESNYAVASTYKPKRPKLMTDAIQKSSEAGMKYLAACQRSDGSWLSNGSDGNYPMAMTALSGLALMSGGSTPESGKYRKNVARALDFILEAAEEYHRKNPRTKQILITTGATSHSMYGHGYGMLFLAQCYGVDKDKERSKRIKNVLDGAVALTAASQSTIRGVKGGAGGWYYSPGANTDEGSVTVTQLQALRACRNVGIKVPDVTIGKAVRYLIVNQISDGGIRYSYSPGRGGNSQPALSAAAIACFYAAGVYGTDKGGVGAEAKMVKKLIEYCKRNVTVDSGLGFYNYSQFYMSQAMYMKGGEDWKKYYGKISDRLLQTQASSGYWPTSYGGVYGAAMSVIILNLPYGYLPIFQT